MTANTPSSERSYWSRELQRNLLRSRNGLKILSGESFAKLGATPKDVVWRARKAELWHYRRATPARFSTPILLYIGLVSRSYILDLHPGNSLIERLLANGYDVFVLDWGIPDEADADNDLSVYVHQLLPRAIRALLKTSRSNDVNLLAYCMGGTLTLLMLGTKQIPEIRSLVTLATPVDFSKMGEFYQPLVEGKSDPDRMIDETGNVPANIIHNTVRVRRPTGDMVQYANLWEKMWSEDFLEGYQAMRRWVADHIPLPGALFREILKDWIQDNGLMAATSRVAGQAVDLSQIRIPVLSVLAEHDELIPFGAARPIADLLKEAECELVPLKSGHVSLVCGRSVEERTMPILLDWFERHSD